MSDRDELGDTSDLPPSLLRSLLGRTLTLPSCRVKCVEGPDRGREWTVELPVVRIGRSSSTEIPLADSTVSRVHAVIKHTPKGWTVVDSGSKHGVALDGVRVQTAYLTKGSRLALGATVLEFSPEVAQMAAVLTPGPLLDGLVGQSDTARELFAIARRVAGLMVTVVITGPTGSGKGALARAIHRAGPRAQKPFAVVDCGNLDPTLVRAELFGHEKGAFTGADQARPGVFEAAQGGTVFIDEIGELPLDLQPRLLRVLEDREVHRLGAAQPVPVDVRILAATNRDLPALVAAGTFREDLYFRLNVVELRVPPLHERRADVPELAAHFLRQCGAPDRLPLAPPVLEVLTRHTWPGNVRELRNAIERALAMAGDDPLAPAHFRPTAPPSTPAAPRAERDPAELAPPSTPGGSPLDAAEAQVIAEVHRRHGGNRTRMAAELGIALTTLRRKLRQYGLE